MLLSIIDDKRKLIPALLVLYICMWEFTLHVVFPIESQLGWAISEHASILFLPAGVIFLSFYLLRWWFIPVVLIGRTFVNVDFYDVGFSWTFILESIFVCLVYPLWLYLLNSANWDVFGDRRPHLADFNRRDDFSDNGHHHHLIGFNPAKYNHRGTLLE